MKSYTYWLKFSEYSDVSKMQNELKAYKENYKAEVVLYYADYSLAMYACVKCNQTYMDLDLTVNSCSKNSFIKLSRKPKDITLSSVQL